MCIKALWCEGMKKEPGSSQCCPLIGQVAAAQSTKHFFTLDSGQRLEQGAQKEDFAFLGAKVLLFCSLHYINLPAT